MAVVDFELRSPFALAFRSGRAFFLASMRAMRARISPRSSSLPEEDEDGVGCGGGALGSLGAFARLSLTLTCHPAQTNQKVCAYVCVYGGG